MNIIRGYYRLAVCGLVLGTGATFIVVTSYLPIKIGRYPLSMWGINGVARLLLWVLRVHYQSPDPDKLRNLEGFIFPNHMTYLDILVLAAITPTRFLAKNSIRSMPFVGQAAKAVGCVFVKRGDKASRKQARAVIAQADRFPPITLFPEGKRGPGTELLPFRYGAFEIVTQTGTPYLPVAIYYDRLDVAIWHRGESILRAAWRLAGRSGRLHVTVHPFDLITPAPTDDPVKLSQEAHTIMTAVLNQQQYTQR